jgi:hypothetical protein
MAYYESSATQARYLHSLGPVHSAYTQVTKAPAWLAGRRQRRCKFLPIINTKKMDSQSVSLIVEPPSMLRKVLSFIGSWVAFPVYSGMLFGFGHFLMWRVFGPLIRDAFVIKLPVPA